MKIGKQKMMFCPECNKETLHTLVSEIQEAEVGDETITGNVVLWKCPECGDGYDVDSSDMDRKYAEAYRKYHNNMLTGAQIKEIRQKRLMTTKEFVEMMNECGIGYSLDEYKEIEADTLAQSGSFEKFVRELGGLPEWAGYKMI